jgi:hypothetical protein
MDSASAARSICRFAYNSQARGIGTVYFALSNAHVTVRQPRATSLTDSVLLQSLTWRWIDPS